MAVMPAGSTRASGGQPSTGRVSKRSAGILPYRRHQDAWQVLLVHPGGPFWAHKDLGAWSMAKGEYLPPESPMAAAMPWPGTTRVSLKPNRLKRGAKLTVRATVTLADGSTTTLQKRISLR